ncbi:MAG TPA: carboxypeptidase regulatory-like domain-containing protein [Candidatus Saccharimonadales bacterium]|nr:carboxypeptidase regulatory-like domain-containing protein [Candidatus Saccharimonadales bacterium]
MTHSRIAPILLLFLTLLAMASFSFAQALVSLSGSVLDPSGAPIPSATVTLRNAEQSFHQTTTTDAEGHYAFASTPSGRYFIEIESPSFQIFRQPVVELTSAASVVLDAHLLLNQASTVVEVSADALRLDLSSTQTGETLSGKDAMSIPLNGRSVTNLLAVQAGVVPASSQQPNAVVMAGAASTPPSGDLDPGNLSVSGQRETTNGFQLNGSTIQEAFNMGTAIVPNLDSVQELRVLTNNFDSEYGNYSGGQVILVTKSGTDAFHGSAFEFLRNTSLDAKNYFSTERAKFDRHQYGGTLGGPVRPQQTYFFLDYQGTQMTQGVESGLISVPSTLERSGNFSNISDVLTGTVKGPAWADSLAQKLGYPVAPNEPYYVTGCATSTQCVFPNVIIPQSVWSAPARNLLQYIPSPNKGINGFSTSAQNEIVSDNKGGARFDANTHLGSFSAYYSIDDYTLDNPYPTGQGGANVPGFNAVSLGRAQLLSLGYTTYFGSNAINEFHFSAMRFANDVGQPVGGVGPTLASQGFVSGAGTLGIVPLAPSIEGIENVVLNDLTFGVNVTGETQVNNTFQWTDNVTRIFHKHTLKAGVSLHLDQINIDPDAVYNGSFQFEGTETGSDFADFLLGVASYYRQGDSKSFYLRNKYFGVFAQDSWQVKPSLTFNYGVRWDLLPPWYEKYNQLQTLVLGQQSIVYPNAPQGLVFPGDPGVPQTLAPTQYKNFAPRFGVSYSPAFQDGVLQKVFGAAGATNIRAGYGIFYTAFEGLSAGIMSANPPYGYDYDSSTLGPPLFSTPFVAAATGNTLGQPFPSPIPAYGASATNPNTTVDWSKYLPITGVPSFFHQNVSPYTESFTLSVQRQLTRDSVLSVSYVGSQAHHLLVLLSANPGNPDLCLATPGCGPFSESGARGPFSGQFDAVSYQKTIGNSNYNSLEVNFRHSSGPLQFLIGYTYGKSIDQSSSLSEPVNPVDPSLSRAISAFDMRHNFVASYDYELPFHWLTANHDRLTRGWSVSGITRFSSGFPVTLFNNKDTSLLGTIPNGINNNGVDTPNFTPGLLQINTDPRNGRLAFNTSLFSLPALGEMGTAGRRIFYGPGISNFDVALVKHLPLTERKSLEFRVEAFNVFNHAQFYGPAAVNGDVNSQKFGEIVSAAAPRLLQLAVRFQF